MPANRQRPAATEPGNGEGPMSGGNWAERVKRSMGLDGAIAYTVGARLSQIAGSTGTVLLIIRYMSAVEQGYYYTLLSLVALQTIFELGFSFVIQQLAAHETVHLKLDGDGTVGGDAAAHARLASVLQLTLRWYRRAAVLLAVLLLPLGFFFFSRDAGAVARVGWQGPWVTAALAVSGTFLLTPFYSFLEGCNQVRQVARLRLFQALVVVLVSWAAIRCHHGLYACALVNLGTSATGAIFLFGNRRLLLGLLRHPAGEHAVSWKREVWPFQWRIAGSWMCSYFTVQIFIPILFALRGPVEAGQMGMSLSITGYMTILALAWTSTKTTPFGRMIAQRDFRGLDRLFQRVLGQSLAAFVLLGLAACSVALGLSWAAPHLAARMVSPRLFALLVVAAGANCAVQCLAALLRSFKSEPFLTQSVAVTVLMVLLAGVTAPRWGNAGAAFSYLAATGGVALPSAVVIFNRARRGYLTGGALTECGGEAG